MVCTAFRDGCCPYDSYSCEYLHPVAVGRGVYKCEYLHPAAVGQEPAPPPEPQLLLLTNEPQPQSDPPQTLDPHPQPGLQPQLQQPLNPQPQALPRPAPEPSLAQGEPPPPAVVGADPVPLFGVPSVDPSPGRAATKGADGGSGTADAAPASSASPAEAEPRAAVPAAAAGSLEVQPSEPTGDAQCDEGPRAGSPGSVSGRRVSWAPLPERCFLAPEPERFMSICAMPPFAPGCVGAVKQHEELRWEDSSLGSTAAAAAVLLGSCDEAFPGRRGTVGMAYAPQPKLTAESPSILLRDPAERPSSVCASPPYDPDRAGTVKQHEELRWEAELARVALFGPGVAAGCWAAAPCASPPEAPPPRAEPLGFSSPTQLLPASAATRQPSCGHAFASPPFGFANPLWEGSPARAAAASGTAGGDSWLELSPLAFMPSASRASSASPAGVPTTTARVEPGDSRRGGTAGMVFTPQPDPDAPRCPQLMSISSMPPFNPERFGIAKQHEELRWEDSFAGAPAGGAGGGEAPPCSAVRPEASKDLPAGGAVAITSQLAGSSAGTAAPASPSAPSLPAGPTGPHAPAASTSALPAESTATAAVFDATATSAASATAIFPTASPAPTRPPTASEAVPRAFGPSGSQLESLYGMLLDPANSRPPPADPLAERFMLARMRLALALGDATALQGALQAPPQAQPPTDLPRLTSTDLAAPQPTQQQ